MSFINKTANRDFRSKAHANFMGGPSYDINNPLLRLRVAASSCFFGEPMYYHRDKDDKRPVRAARSYAGRLGDSRVQHLADTLNSIQPVEWRTLSPAELMETAIDAALAHDFEATLKFAVELRNDLNIRTTPQVILVRAANRVEGKATGLVRKYANEVVRRPDDMTTQLAYQLAKYGRKGIPMQLRKAWGDKLNGSKEYALAKYRMESREVKLVDVLNLAYGLKAGNPVLDKLAKGNLKLSEDTWESIVSKKGSTPEAWSQAIDVMGHMALLRNVRNLIQKGLDPNLFVEKLVAGAPTGKQLPFRYFSAYKAVEGLAKPQVLDAIEDCLIASVGNLPKFDGVTVSAVDNSGSAHGAHTSALGTMPVNHIGNLMGILTAMASDEGHVAVFGDRLEMVPVRKRSSVFDQLKAVNKAGDRIGHSTENGIWLLLDKMIREKMHVDNLFVYSDQQAGHGGLYGTRASDYRDYIFPGTGNYIDVPKLVARYRREVNPNVNVFLVQIAGYQDTLMPEFFDRTYILGGWSEDILRFAAEMITLRDGRQRQLVGQ